MASALALLLFVGLIGLAVAFVVTRRRRWGHPGTGATGAVYELLNEDKRNAIEIILEERAEYRDPENRDGDLPQLERPKAR